MTITFEPWPKIPRLNKDIIVTEKIDGTNGAIIIVEAEGDLNIALENKPANTIATVVHNGDGPPDYEGCTAFFVGAQSRNKLIEPGKADNAGFAGWVQRNAEMLVHALGPGRHFGEWWGPGIQRTYDEEFKRFSLFNVDRYTDLGDGHALHLPDDTMVDVVPELYRGPFSQAAIEDTLETLRTGGSAASTGYMRPEGVVVYHAAARQTFKVLLEGDDVPKGQA